MSFLSAGYRADVGQIPPHNFTSPVRMGIVTLYRTCEKRQVLTLTLISVTIKVHEEGALPRS